MLYARQNDNPAATFANFEQAQRLFEAQNNAEGRAEVHYQRGFYYYMQGKIPEARAELEQALKLAGEVGNQAQRVRALLQLCAVAYKENNSALAERYAQEALEAAQALGMETLTARAHVELGGVYMAASSTPKPRSLCSRGFDYARRNKAQRAEAQALINLGSLRYQQGRADEAHRVRQPRARILPRAPASARRSRRGCSSSRAPTGSRAISTAPSAPSSSS